MKQHFVNEFISTLSLDNIPDDMIKIIYNKLSLFVNDYKIFKEEKSIIPYTGYLPEFYKVYIATRKVEGLSESSLKMYNYQLIRFFKYLNKDIKEISTNDVRLFLFNIQQETGMTNESLDTVRTVISTFFEWSVNEDYLQKNPCKNIKRIKFNKKPRKAISNLDLEKIRMACSTIREHAIIEFLYSTGCRLDEIVNLKISDIDFVNKEVMLLGKGSKYRTSFINAKCELYVTEYIMKRDDNNPWVFVSDRYPHNKLSKSGLEKIVRLIGERAGLEYRLIPHLIRHTTATDGLSRGMDVTELQKMLGHVKIDTTMIYAEVSKDNIKHSHIKAIV